MVQSYLLTNWKRADVTVISRTKDKKADALGLGADRLLVSTDETAIPTKPR